MKEAIKIIGLIIILIFCLILIAFFSGIEKDSSNKITRVSDNQEEKQRLKKEDYFIVAPHHSISSQAIDDFYKNISSKYKQVENVVIISPNHYNEGTQFMESFKQDGIYCYAKNSKHIDDRTCIRGGTLDFYNYKKSETFDLVDYKNYKKGTIFSEDKFVIFEHGVGEHFSYINKYFGKYKKVYPVVIKIENNGKFSETKKVLTYLENYNFGDGKTLFILSVDFSHHVFEKLALFHDMRSIDELNKDDFKVAEVDCSNCLFLGKSIANKQGKNIFTLHNRTSSSEIVEENINYDNTSHVFGEFVSGNLSEKEKIKKQNIEHFDKYETITTTKTQLNKSTNKNPLGVIYGMFFGDSHLTRSFDYLQPYKNIIPASYKDKRKYFQCFYQNKDINKNVKVWKNRLFHGMDYVGINFETAMCEKEYTFASEKSIKFNTNVEYLKYFTDIGINMFNLANNHSYDYGNTCYNRTKKILSDNKLYYFGEGRGNESSIYKSEKNGLKLAFMGINDTTFPWSLDVKVQKIKHLRKQGYKVIVNIHWGLEYKKNNSKWQKTVAHSLVDAGVDMIVGHHPHVVQNFEKYKGVPIFYSLGNFIFDQSIEETLDGMGIVYRIDQGSLKYSIINFKRKKEDFSIDCESWE